MLCSGSQLAKQLYPGFSGTFFVMIFNPIFDMEKLKNVGFLDQKIKLFEEKIAKNLDFSAKFHLNLFFSRLTVPAPTLHGS